MSITILKSTIHHQSCGWWWWRAIGLATKSPKGCIIFCRFSSSSGRNYPCSTGFCGFLNHQLYHSEIPANCRNRRWTRKLFKSVLFQGSNRTLPLKKTGKIVIHFDLTITSDKKESVGDIHHDIHHDITWYSHKYGNIMWSLPVGQ